MKKIILLTLTISLLLSVGFQKNNTTKKNDFQKFLKKSSYQFIPSGKAYVDSTEVNVQSFYISKGEVTNKHYQEFLSYLKATNEIEKLTICQIDSVNWSERKWKNKGMEEHYHLHPAYRDYPVVNISHEAAELYCEYITDQLNHNFPGVNIVARLPTFSEYVRAARGESEDMTYGWNSMTTRNNKGQPLGNFQRICEECITQNQETGKLEINLNGLYQPLQLNYDIIAPSISYWPNQFGLYNLSGNVAEMIDEKGVAVGGSWLSPGYDVRIESKKPFTGKEITVGFRVVFSYLSGK
jgi:formylglycine-generating enzyme required for sulfatase activity